MWNWIWSGCNGIGSDRGWAMVGRVRKKKKNLNRDQETLY